MQQDLILRAVAPDDHDAVLAFLTGSNFSQRHLDWHDPVYWIDRYFTLVIEKTNQIIALLNCAPDSTGIAWVRTFAVKPSVPLHRVWTMIFPPYLEKLKSDDVSQIASVGLYDWFTELLKKTNFSHKQDIISFRYSGDHHPVRTCNQNVELLSAGDLQQVAEVDRAAFDPLWQTPLEGLEAALSVSWHSTVTKQEEKTVGFLIATRKGQNSHLARIAVHPSYQEQGIASALISEYIDHCQRNLILDITLNTQSDNLRSVSLYKKLGFTETGEIYPVYLKEL